jgi:replicative DNA helicase
MVPLGREIGVLGQERLRRWARNQQRTLLDEVDVMWDPIVTIEEIGTFQVYDLTVPGTHNFIAGDVCVHNTTFCLNIAQHAALHHGTPVAIFSLETSNQQVVQRMLASEAEVDGSRLRTGFLSDSDWPKLANAMARLSEAPIFIDDAATINIIEMRAKARKLKAEHGLGLIIIDYLQMIQSYRRTENRTQEISEIARATKSLAKELDVPVIAISQLSRAVEALGNRRPQLSHLRESGELEQVADLVLFIYREDYYNEQTEKKNIAEIHIAKHRNGPTGTVELYFDREHSRFGSLDRRRAGPAR